jgi:hypothetical protein
MRLVVDKRVAHICKVIELANDQTQRRLPTTLWDGAWPPLLFKKRCELIQAATVRVLLEIVKHLLFARRRSEVVIEVLPRRGC